MKLNRIKQKLNSPQIPLLKKEGSSTRLRSLNLVELESSYFQERVGVTRIHKNILFNIKKNYQNGSNRSNAKSTVNEL